MLILSPFDIFHLNRLLSNDVRLINVDWASINQDLTILEEQYVQSLQSFQSYLEMYPMCTTEPVVNQIPLETPEEAEKVQPVDEEN